MPESAGPQRPEPTNPNSDERATEEQIEAMADRMIDGMIGGRKPAPEMAASAPVISPGIEVDGDRGEDIEDRLDSLFGDETVRTTVDPEPAVEIEVEAANPVIDPAPPAPSPSVPAAGQVAVMTQEPAIPWSHTIAKPRRESRRRSDSPKFKWLAAAALAGAMVSFAWLVLAPGSGPVEATRTTNEALTSSRNVPRVTPPAQRPVVLAEPPVSEPIVNTAAIHPAPVPEPIATTAAVEPEPVPEPIATTAAVEPEPTPEEPRLTFELPVAAAAVEPEPIPEPKASPPPRVVEPTVPELISRETPVYRKRDGPGVIVLNVLVGEAGRVSRVVIEEGIPGSPLEASAIDATLRSTYRPATENGRPAKAWIVERLEFE